MVSGTLAKVGVEAVVAGLPEFEKNFSKMNSLVSLFSKNTESATRKMSPFESCCWYWADTYRRLTDQGVIIYPLEALNESFAALMALADQTGARVSRDVWLRHAGKRANVGVSDEEPPVWTFEEVETFAQVAGDVQGWFGYPVEGG